MARYSLLIKPSAAREIESVDQKATRQRIVARVGALADSPRPHGCEKLAGGNDRFRVRVGRFRVLYVVDDSKKVVIVFRVAHRKEVYR